MAFGIFTLICGVVAVVVLASIYLLWKEDGIEFIFIPIIVTLVIASVYFTAMSNRFDVREDIGIISEITQRAETPNQIKVVQTDEYKVTGVVCGVEQCDQLHVGTAVVVRTTYNSVGFTDSQIIVRVNP